MMSDRVGDMESCKPHQPSMDFLCYLVGGLGGGGESPSPDKFAKIQENILKKI